MGDFPIGDPHCPDCHGTGSYQGLGAAEPCKTCEKKEGDNASIEDALGFGDLVEEMFPGELKDGEKDPIQATMDAAPDLSDPKWDDGNDASEMRIRKMCQEIRDSGYKGWVDYTFI